MANKTNLLRFYSWFYINFQLLQAQGWNSWTQDDVNDWRCHWLYLSKQNYWLRFRMFTYICNFSVKTNVFS